MSINWQVDKQNVEYIYIIEYYLAVKNNEVLIHVATQTDLEPIMLTERSQTQKATYYMTPFICNFWKS